MKKINIIGGIAILLLIALTWSCKKNVLRVSPYDLTDGQALLKINYASPYAANPSVQIKINGIRVSPATINYPTPFPGGGLNTNGTNFADYFSVTPGKDSVVISIPKKNTNEDSLVVFATTVTTVANEYQTLHITDTAANTQTVYILDPANKPDSGFVKYKFVNLIPNSTGIDLYFGATKLLSNFAYKQVSDTFSLPAGNSLAWSIRAAGAAVPLNTIMNRAVYTSASTVANQRVFTIYAAGYIGLTDATRPARVSFIYNK